MNLEQQLAAFYRRKDKRFVEKLWDLVENNELDDVIRWGTDGTYIVIPNTTTFEERVLKVYFKTKVYSSFVRQLHMYGFRKRTQEVELTATGACNFEHKLFSRGKFDQLLRIQRTQPKNRKERALAFRALPFVGRNQRAFQRPTATMVTQPAHCLTTRFNYHVSPTVNVPGILATQLYHRPGNQSVIRSAITTLQEPQDNKENSFPKSASKLPPLLLLAEICSAILSKGHPETDEQRRQCIQVATESIERGYRRDQCLHARRFTVKPTGVITTSINTTVPFRFIRPTTEVKLGHLMAQPCPEIQHRPLGKQILLEIPLPAAQNKLPPATNTTTPTTRTTTSTTLDDDETIEGGPLVIDID